MKQDTTKNSTKKRGGARSTTWKRGQPPPVKKPKGAKHKTTLIKEKLGLKSWEGLKKYIENEGATKLIAEMQKLRGRYFIQAFSLMAEFVKPKLSRTTITERTDVSVLKDFNFKNLTKEELKIFDTLSDKLFNV